MNKGTKKAFPHLSWRTRKDSKEHCNNGVLVPFILTQKEWREQVMKKKQWNQYESSILNDLDSFTLEKIEQGIDELETRIGKTYFGDPHKEKLKILYVLRNQTTKKELSYEVAELKNKILEEWLSRTNLREARIKTFDTWLKYQNQHKGIEFVYEGLKKELRNLQFLEVGAV